jgi:uncharacterized protein
MMYIDNAQSAGEATSQERRDRAQPDSRVLGRVVQCDGAHAMLAAYADDGEGTMKTLWAVGRLVSINLGSIRTVGLIYSIESPTMSWQDGGHNPITVHVELIGEVRDMANGKPVFDRGITAYPHIGAISHRIRARDLEAVYDLAGRHAVSIGQLSQDDAISARIAIDDTLNRHFAVVGTTGVGKSTAVSLLLRKAITAKPDLRVLILDPHNEFSSAFPDHSIRIDSTTLDLPFWLFKLEEFVEVLFRGREADPEEVDLLRDLIPQAKQLYRNPGSQGSIMRRSLEGNGLTADTPVPYRMAELIRLIDERMGLLESKNDRPVFRTLRARIEAALADPRYRFMFASRLIEDTIHKTIGRIFRVPHEGKPITCFELAGLPSEVVNSVCSVLARLAFDLALGSDGRLKLLVLCEEAHRYMPADPRLGFAPTRHALSRIAKEGRKYGCFLGVVTQRPGELDPTVLSQCSTVFAMRLSNEGDQAIIRSAIADSSASTLSFLSSMGQREAIAFGEGVATTMRMKFEQLDRRLLPGTSTIHQEDGGTLDNDFDLAAIIDRMRNVGRPQHGTSVPESVPLTPATSQAGDQSYRAPRAGGFDETTHREALRRRLEEDESFRRLYE